MLPPEYLEGLPEPILELYALVEDDILRDMARRIAAFDYYIPAADWQNLKLKEAGRMQEDILKVLAKYTGRSEEELRKLMEKATSDGLRSDISVYEAHGETVPPISDSKRLVDTLNAGYAATRGTMRNITRTTANTATQQFERALDKAWLQVRSGGFSYDTAVRSAVKELAGRGVEAIRYPTGHVDTLETAVRRAVVTGINQTTCRLQEELAAEMGMDLVEVSAHAGARPSHAVWQGKIFSLSGNSTKYPKFAEATGYGTGPGLGGWNCRHSFSPYYEGSPRAYPPELLEKYEAKDIEYNGEKMTEYEASQKQRYMERQVRRWKREKEALEAAGLDSGEARKKIREWQAALRDFTDQTGLKRQNAREQIGVAGDKKAVANPLKSGIRNMALGLRQPPSRMLDAEEIASIEVDASALGIPKKMLRFNQGRRTGYDEREDLIFVRGDVLPDLTSRIARDRMSSRAVLAHEYYGHRKNSPSEYDIGDWRDEFRASRDAALHAPNLSDEDRGYLIIDAYDRAKEVGKIMNYDKEAKRILYGYEIDE